MFNRLIHEKSFYPTKNLLEANDFNNYLKGNIKRQHLANPNINFATFSQFKNNIVRNYKLQRSNSTRNIESISRNDGYELEKYNKGAYSDINYGNQTNQSLNNYNNIVKKNYRRNNNDLSFVSTIATSKTGKNRSRCQSSYILRSKNNV